MIFGDHTSTNTYVHEDAPVEYRNEHGGYLNGYLFNITRSLNPNHNFIEWRIEGDARGYQLLSEPNAATLSIEITDASLGNLRVYADYTYVGHWDCDSSTYTCTFAPYQGKYGLESECIEDCDNFVDDPPKYTLENCACVSDNGSGTGDFPTEEDCLQFMTQTTFNCVDGQCVEDDMHMGTYSSCFECMTACSEGTSIPCDDITFDYAVDCTYIGPNEGFKTECDCQ